MRFRLLLKAVIVGTAAIVLACGGGSDKSPTPSAMPSPTFVPTARPTGATVTLSSGASDFPGGFDSVFFVNGQTGWVSGYLKTPEHGVILSTADGGRTWEQQYTADRPIGHLQFLSPLIGWALVEPFLSADAVTLLHTTDGGHTWAPIADMDHRPATIDFITPTFGRAVLAGRLEETLDSGKTWTTVTASTSLHSICFSDAENGWATDGTSILRTTDGGRTWTVALAQPSDHFQAYPPAARTVWCQGHDVVWGVFWGGAAAGNLLYALYRTVDSGISWEPVLSYGYPELQVPERGPTPGSLYIIDRVTAFFSNYCGPCGDSPASVQITSDAGKTWGPRLTIPHLYEADIVFSDASRGWAVGRSPDRGSAQAIIVATSDGGQTWTQQYP